MNLINLTGKISHGYMAEERTMVAGSQKSASEVFTEFAKVRNKLFEEN